MSKYLTKAQAIEWFKVEHSDILGTTDRPLARQTWNDWVDSMKKRGKIRPTSDWTQPDFIAADKPMSKYVTIADESETWYIDYLNKEDHFRQARKTFTGDDAYEQAEAWGRQNLENFNLDMIKLWR
jgi:hypothetical protein